MYCFPNLSSLVKTNTFLGLCLEFLMKKAEEGWKFCSCIILQLPGYTRYSSLMLFTHYPPAENTKMFY